MICDLDNERCEGDARTSELSYPLQTVCLFVSAAFSAAAGNPLQLGYQEGPACPYKGKLTRGALTHVNVKR